MHACKQDHCSYLRRTNSGKANKAGGMAAGPEVFVHVRCPCPKNTMPSAHVVPVSLILEGVIDVEDPVHTIQNTLW